MVWSISCRRFARNGAPSRRVKDWSGRWWSLWGAIDLVPMGDKVLTIMPGFPSPFTDADEIAVSGRNTGRIALANGYGSHGEPVRCLRAKSGQITALWLGASKLLPAARAAREIEARYGKRVRRSARRHGRGKRLR